MITSKEAARKAGEIWNLCHGAPTQPLSKGVILGIVATALIDVAGGEKPDQEDDPINRRDGPVHGYFGLSYAAYLVWPRALMQEMDLDWQARFAAIAREIDYVFKWPKGRYAIRVCWTNDDGELIGKGREDPLADYRRPDPKRIEACRIKK